MSDNPELYDLPSDSVEVSPYVWVYFNREWLPIVLGMVSRLYNLNLWNVASNDEEQLIEANVSTLLTLFGEGDENMPCQDFRNAPDNPNQVEVSCDGGETWRPAFLLNGTAVYQQTRYNEDGHKEVSNDGGETWINDDENDPRFTGTTGETDETGEASCKAAENITNRSQEIAEELLAILTSTPTLVAIVLGITTFIAALITFPVAIPFVVAFVTVVVTYTIEQIEEALDEDAFEAFKCIIVCTISNNPVGSQGRVTLANFDEIVSQIRAQFTGIAAAFFEMYVQVLGASGLVIVSRLGSAAGTSCEECLCETFVFRLFGDEPTALGSYEINQGEYDAGLNKVYGSVSAGTYDPEAFLIDAQIGVCADTAFVMTRAIVWYHTVVNNPFTPRDSYIERFTTSPCIGSGDELRRLGKTTSGSYVMDSGIINVNTTGVRVYLSARSAGNTSDIVVIDRVEIHGEGANPFDTA